MAQITPSSPAALVIREYSMALGLLPPEPDELFQFVGLVFGQVAALGEIDGKVVQLPPVVIEVVAADMPGDALNQRPSCSATSAREPNIS